MGWIFNRTAREPDMDGRNHRDRVWGGILRQARADGRSIDSGGFRIGGQHRGRRDGRSNDSDETERSGGDNWTRRRPDRW